MPEPGVTPQPTVKQGKGPDALPWGEAAQVNDAIGLIPPPEEDTFTPQGDSEQFLYSGTDRPQEPVTSGVPFGGGRMSMPSNYQSDEQLMGSFIQRAANDPSAPPELKRFTNRALRGE